MRTTAVVAAWLTAGLATICSGQTISGTSPLGLFYEASGAGEPVVLIHGFSLDRRMWEPQVAALETRFRVIRYDLRGHGKSADVAEPYSAFDDLRSVLDALEIRQATLVGLSAGAELAIDFAITYPDRVTRLVLASPGLGGFVPKSPLTWIQPVAQASAAGDSERAARLWLDTPLMALRNDASAAPLVNRIVMDNTRIWSFRSNPIRRLTPPAIGRLGEIRAPTLVIVGEQDQPHILEVGGLLSTGIAAATTVTIPRAGHLVNVDAAPSFTDALARFLQ